MINFIFPPLCVHCGTEGAWLCNTAQQELKRENVITNPIDIKHVDCVLVRGSYDCAPLAQLVQKLKYHYWTGVSDTLEAVLQPLVAELHVPKDTVIVPVPLHARRQRERGFNQSLIISKALSRLTGLRVANILQRQRYTTPQAHLSAVERTTNIIGAFSQGAEKKWPKSVLLVDDVITTGSTISECAGVLRQNGVQKITAIAIAKG